MGNPFLISIASGISVKTYEAMSQGFPIVTSSHGLAGLGNIKDCKKLPMPNDPSSPGQLASFFLKHVVDDKGYKAFVRKMKHVSRSCLKGQKEKYPAKYICQ